MADTDQMERRQWERKAVTKSALLIAESGSKDVETLDLSTHGARIWGKVDLKPGEPARLVAKKVLGEPAQGRVAWVGQKSPAGDQEAGLTFVNSLNLRKLEVYG